ncbi:hypothetical protein R83H12_01959 [Fibrobacteria bacterium R8-3-H12]
MSFIGTIIIKEEEDWFVATCLENDIASQGKTTNEAISNLKEAIALYYEDCKRYFEKHFSSSRNRIK